MVGVMDHHPILLKVDLFLRYVTLRDEAAGISIASYKKDITLGVARGETSFVIEVEAWARRRRFVTMLLQMYGLAGQSAQDCY